MTDINLIQIKLWLELKQKELEKETDIKSIYHLLEAHISDLVDTATFHGECMAERVRRKQLDPEKM